MPASVVEIVGAEAGAEIIITSGLRVVDLVVSVALAVASVVVVISEAPLVLRWDRNLD